MTQVKKELVGNVLNIHLSGTIDEATNFSTLIGSVPQEIRVDSSKVDRISSVGIGCWMRYFNGLVKGGIKVTFVFCSPAIVEQINSIQDFIQISQIESILLPYACARCSEYFSIAAYARELKKFEAGPPSQPCPKCSSPSAFDDIPEEYLEFLKRLP